MKPNFRVFIAEESFDPGGAMTHGVRVDMCKLIECPRDHYGKPALQAAIDHIVDKGYRYISHTRLAHDRGVPRGWEIVAEQVRIPLTEDEQVGALKILQRSINQLANGMVHSMDGRELLAELREALDTYQLGKPVSEK